jgi:hypothetical protein
VVVTERVKGLVFHAVGETRCEEGEPGCPYITKWARSKASTAPGLGVESETIVLGGVEVEGFGARVSLLPFCGKRFEKKVEIFEKMGSIKEIEREMKGWRTI